MSVGKGAADVSFLLAEGRITRVRRPVATKTPSGECLIPKILGGLQLHDVHEFKCVRLVGLTSQINGFFFYKSKNHSKAFAAMLSLLLMHVFRQQASQLLSLMGRQPAK